MLSARIHLDENNPAALASPEPAHVIEGGINGVSRDNGEQPGNTEEFAYDRVPAKRAVTVSVLYRIRGRGRPLPYPVDEGDTA
jgi:hypothetical protein